MDLRRSLQNVGTYLHPCGIVMRHMDPHELPIFHVRLLEGYWNFIDDDSATWPSLAVLYGLSNSHNSLGERGRGLDPIIIVFVSITQPQIILVVTPLREWRKVTILKL